MADRRLQVFHTVARLLSFTKAAESLHMTQPAVTLYAKMENAVRDLTGEISGILIIGASTTIAEYMLPALLGDFKREYQDINVHLKVSNSDGIVSMVDNNDIDLGIVEAPVMNKNLVVETCRSDRLVAIVPPQHSLASQQKVNLKDLMEHAYIAREEGSGTREVIHEYLTNAGMKPAEIHIAMELGSPEAIKGAVEAGMGVSIVSEVTIQKEKQLGTLVSLELEPPLERPFSFVHQKQKFRQRAMDELLDFSRAYCLLHKGDS
jgi:DNA-binding transcriptional LysR family regulator